MRLLNELKNFIDRKTPGTVDWLRSEILRIRGNALESKTIRVLDIGSSEGKVWTELAGDGWLNRHKIALTVTLFDATVESGDLSNGEGNLFLRSQLGIAPRDLSNFASDEFDLISALHVIEHLSKEDGYLLLYQINRLSAHSVIGTPNGFAWQPPFRDNPFQAHISSWTSKELRTLGWKKQYGEGGLKFLVGPGAVAKWRISTSKVRRLFSAPERVLLGFSQLFLHHLPFLHAMLFAIRRERAFDLDAHVQLERS